MNILHSKIIGSGKNHLIILHGLLGMGDNWKSIANKLSSEGYWTSIGNNISAAAGRFIFIISIRHLIQTSNQIQF